MALGFWTRVEAGPHGAFPRFAAPVPLPPHVYPLQQPSSHPGQDLPIPVPALESGPEQVLSTRSEVRAAGEAVDSGSFKDLVVGKKK